MLRALLTFWRYFPAPPRSVHRGLSARQEAIQQITEYIEIFYNRQRKQAKLGYLAGSLRTAVLQNTGSIIISCPLLTAELRFLSNFETALENLAERITRTIVLLLLPITTEKAVNGMAGVNDPLLAGPCAIPRPPATNRLKSLDVLRNSLLYTLFSIGVSPNGKATASDAVISWFESRYPCQFNCT